MPAVGVPSRRGTDQAGGGPAAEAEALAVGRAPVVGAPVVGVAVVGVGDAVVVGTGGLLVVLVGVPVGETGVGRGV
jgi:hypothetical protein